MSQSTITVQQVVNYASQHTQLMPLIGVGGYSNEPALSLANDTLSTLLSAPFPWKFNRVAAPFFVTRQYKQDYKFAGAVAWTQNGGAAIGLASANAITEAVNTVTVNTIEDHNFNVGDTVFMSGNTVAAYNSTLTQNISGTTWSGGWTITATPTTKQFQFTHASSGLSASGAPGITDFSWLEYATMVNINDTSAAPYIWYLQAVRNLEPASRSWISDRVAVFSDDGAGTLTIRLRYLPGPQPFQISVVYQQRPTLITSLSNTWAPFPDEYARVYRQMFLAHAYRFAGSPRADIEFQRAEALAMQAVGMNDRELAEEYISPDTSIAGVYGWDARF